MSLMATMVLQRRRTLRMTILRRPGRTWDYSEVNRMVNGLMTEANYNAEHPEYVVLVGHYTKEQALKAVVRGAEFTATQVTGSDSKELPFIPSFV